MRLLGTRGPECTGAAGTVCKRQRAAQVVRRSLRGGRRRMAGCLQLTPAAGMRTVLRASFAIGLPIALCCASAVVAGGQEPDPPWNCLHALSVGRDGKPVVPCDPGDPFALSASPAVGAVMAYLGIPPGSVRFNGCKGAIFAAGTDPLHAGGYLVTYPLDAPDRILGPITHELAHVMQMRIAGARKPEGTDGRARIELGADFVAGIVFRAEAGRMQGNDFENDVQLAGRYREARDDAHGNPSQRGAAFRYGLNFHFTPDVPDIQTASRYFGDVLYDDIVRL